MYFMSKNTSIDTVKIKDKKRPGQFRIINKIDFNHRAHELWVESETGAGEEEVVAESQDKVVKPSGRKGRKAEADVAQPPVPPEKQEEEAVVKAQEEESFPGENILTGNNEAIFDGQS